MKKRIFSMFLALVMLLGILPVTSLAAPTLEEAMAEVSIYGKYEPLEWLTMNGSVKTQRYTYYKYESPVSGRTKEIPAYCVDPRLHGVPVLAPDGTPFKYSASETMSDYKLVGIVSNGYPHQSLETLGLQTKEEAYYATKTAVWTYLLADWSIDKLGINPNLSGADKEAAERVLQAAKTIYWRGTMWNKMYTPKLTATADRDKAYPVTINGQSCYQQVFTINSETWAIESVHLSLADGAPAGTKILDMNDQEITKLVLESYGDGCNGQCKVVYPASSVEGQAGSAQLNMSCVVDQYVVYYAKTLEQDKYGNIQDYLLDTDPNVRVEGSAISQYSADPDKPEEPDEPNPGITQLKITKLETGTDTPLEGAVFEVLYPDGSSAGSFSTNASGVITIPLSITGNYTVTEKSAPEFHLLPVHTTQNVTVLHGKTAELTFYNDPFGNLRVHKVSDTGDNLEGVSVQIKHIATGETRTGKTNQAGVVTFTELKPGGWEVRETAGIEGWIAETDTVQTVAVVSGEESTATIVNKELPGLRIIKYDRKNMALMPDVTFEVWRDGESLGRFQTDQQGEILITNAQPGTYRAVEMDTGSDGHILDTTPQEVELHAGDGIKELVFFNDVKPGLRLVKVDSANPSKGILNAVFEIKSVAGDYGPEEFRTDRNGEIDLSKLPAGAYVVTEKACEGYIIDEAQRIIQLDSNEDAEFVFTNTIKPSIQIVKRSSDGTPLGGVHFRIAKIEDGSHYLDRVTDQNGEINISDLELGVYSVRETATTSDHIIDVREYHVELFPGKTSTLTVENQKRPNLIIRKTDKDTGKPIPGVTFTLRGADGPTITTEPTGQDGTVTISNLLPGPYTVTEQNVPENYILDTTPQTVTLFPNRTATVQFQNFKRPTLKITKVDINGRFLTGAIFEVKTKAGVEIGDFPVGPDGSITVSNIHLTEGYFIITELQAPEGYILDKTPHEVYLRPGKTTEVSIENEKKPGLTIYKVDSIVGDGIKGAKFKIYVSKDKTEHGTYQELDSTFYYTDASGIIHLDNLDTGWYKIVEVEPAAGFTIKEPAEQILYVEHDKLAEVTFENTPLNAILVEKYDNVTHAALPGCTFQLRYLAGTSGTGGTVIGQKVTGKNGTALWTGLKPGAYVIEEVDPGDGYSIINSSETVFIADNGEQSVITARFSNSPDGNLLVRKVCSVNPGITLAGAEFKVTYADGTLIGDGNGIFTTDENGEIRVEGLKPGKSVIVTETKAPAGFIIDTQSQTVQIKEGRTVSLTFKNQPRGKLIIQKRDSQTNAPLSGAEFRVTTAAGCEVGLDGVIGTATLTQNGLFTTDSNGEIRISNLVPGAYVLTETRVPSGYVMDSPSTNVVIGPNGDTQTVIITNTPKATLTITKRDAVTRKPLANAEFIVRDSEGHAVGPTNGIYKTGTDGTVIVSGLEPGSTIMVSETKAPTGYILDETPKSIVVKSGISNSLIFDNQPGTTLIIRKFIEGTENEPLSGVCFRVTDGNGAAVGPDDGTHYTDKAGEIVLSGIEPGTTVIAREIKTVDGFVLDGTPQDILIKGGEVQQLTFWNKRAGNLIINKVDGIDKHPLAGVRFKITYADGSNVDQDGGKTSTNGIYVTDSNGQIKISDVVGTVIITELETIDGYYIKEENRTQTVVVNPDDTQTVTVYNVPMGGLTIIKKDEETGERISGVQFEIRKLNGEVIGNYTTDRSGVISLPQADKGWYQVTELKAAKGYRLDSQPYQVEVKDGGTATLEITNRKAGSAIIHKVDSLTGEGIYGVKFLVSDSKGNPIGTYESDNEGYVYVDGGLADGKYTVRELECAQGYILDTVPKTFYVEYGGCTTITWPNTAVRGQIQIVKKSAEYNSLNGLPAGTLLEGATFEIYNERTGNKVDTIVTGANGLASSKALPLGRYTIRETKAPVNYGVSTDSYTAVLEYSGQIVRLEITNKSLSTGVSIEKTGPKEAMSGQPVRYVFSRIGNTSNVMLQSYYWRDTLPTAVRLDKVVTGTYNFPGTYKIVYKVNDAGDYRTLADSLSTSRNYTFAASPAALGLAANERVTEVMFVFGQVPGGFSQVEAPMLYCIALPGLAPGSSFANVADVGGTHNGVWVQGVTRWVTTVYGKPTTLPRTGY